MDKEVILFTMLGCLHCDETKERLTSEGIVFTDLDIAVFEEMWTEIVYETGSDIVPTLVITNPENEGEATIYLPNIDFSTIDELVDIIKK